MADNVFQKARKKWDAALLVPFFWAACGTLVGLVLTASDYLSTYGGVGLWVAEFDLNLRWPELEVAAIAFLPDIVMSISAYIIMAEENVKDNTVAIALFICALVVDVVTDVFDITDGFHGGDERLLSAFLFAIVFHTLCSNILLSFTVGFMVEIGQPAIKEYQNLRGQNPFNKSKSTNRSRSTKQTGRAWH